ncbi:MAG: iron ABC transporter permease [Arcanobacterium sp.]|nr:iron ABC transporter permease [Arcanobacterium sp.]
MTSDGQFFQGLQELLAQEHLWRIIGQTFGLAFAGTFFSVLLGIPGAFILYCRNFRGRALLRGIITVPFVLPTIVVGISFRVMLEGPLGFLGLSQSVTAVVLAMVFFNFSVVVRTVGSMWQGLDPRLSQAARTLGATSFTAFRTVTLPQLTPAIMAAASLVFLYCSTAYGIVTTLGNPGWGTLETEIYLQTVVFFNLDTAAILSLIQFIFVLFTLLVTTRLTKRNETALRVTSFRKQGLKSEDIPAFVATLFMVIFVVAPLFSIVLRSLRVRDEWSFGNYLSLQEVGLGFSGGTTAFEAMKNSLTIAFDATLITVIVGIPLAILLSRRVSGFAMNAQQFLDGIVLLPLGVSAVTVGFGFLLTFQGTLIGESKLLLPIAQAIVALPLFLRALVPLLRAIHPRMKEAAALLGASPGKILITVDLPIVLRGIGLAVGFAFAVSLGEFGASSFLADPQHLTLPVLIVRLLSRPGANNYGIALASAVILAIVTAAVVIIAEVCANKERISQ